MRISESYNKKVTILEALKYIELDVSVYEPLNENESNNILVLHFNRKLKELQTYSEFYYFLNALDTFGFNLRLVGKRRSYEAYAFSHIYDIHKWDYNLNKVHYLYADGISTGRSYVHNLHRALKVIS